MARAKRSASALSAVILFSLLLVAGSAQARPGDLDLTFGGGAGYVTTRVGDEPPHRDLRDDHVSDLIVLNDGRILALGGSPDGYSAARYMPDGSLDPTFGGGDGVVAGGPYPCGGESFCYTGLTDGELQSDGSVVTGSMFDWMARLNPDGTWDETFPRSEDYVTSLEVMPDDKIVGISYGGNWWKLFRLQPDGDHDRSFYEAGIRYMPSVIRGKAGGVWSLADLAVLDDGRILIAGTTTAFRNGERELCPFLARLNADGTWDRTFGRRGTGWVVWKRLGYGTDLLQLRDGRVFFVAAGVDGGVATRAPISAGIAPTASGTRRSAVATVLRSRGSAPAGVRFPSTRSSFSQAGESSVPGVSF